MSNVKANNMKLENLYLVNMPIKIFIGVLIVLVILFFGYFLLFSSQLENIEQLEAQEETLKQDFTKKANQAAFLPVLKEELKQLEAEFEILVKQLPTDSEVPGLIQELHQAAANNGLKFTSLKPNVPETLDSVKVISYDIVTSGNYDQLIEFAASVGGLNRIVVLDKFNLKNAASNKSSKMLEFRAKANTFQSVSVSESGEQIESSDNN